MSGTDRVGVTIYSAKNCDTMKKVRPWLVKRVYTFHDYKTADKLET